MGEGVDIQKRKSVIESKDATGGEKRAASEGRRRTFTAAKPTSAIILGKTTSATNKVGGGDNFENGTAREAGQEQRTSTTKSIHHRSRVPGGRVRP